MKKINLNEFYRWQKELDEEILKKHHLTFKETAHHRLLALIVELGEFANETRCFKFWSQKKDVDKQKINLEYADAFHFFLSLGHYFPKCQKSYLLKKPENFFFQLLKVFSETNKLIKNFSLSQYQKAFRCFLQLSFFYQIDINRYYLQKRKENFRRQKNNY